MHLLVLTWAGLSRRLALATAAMISGMLANVKGRTSELLISFIRFELGGVLLFGLFLSSQPQDSGSQLGDPSAELGLAVQCGGLWGMTFLRRCFWQ